MTLVDPMSFGFRSVGIDVTIREWVRITSPETIDVGDHVMVDDFVFLQGGERLRIGSYVHVHSFATVNGGGPSELGDLSGLAAGTRLVTGTDRQVGLTGGTVPPELRVVERPGIAFGPLAATGVNAVVLPGVNVGEGAIIGANSLVVADVEPWTVHVGSPSRPVRMRAREPVLEKAKRLGYDPSIGRCVG